MYYRTPFFVIIEGIDGSGKTTLAKGLCSKLGDAYYTYEPSGSDAGKLAEKYSLTNSNNSMLLTLLYTADRIIHVDEISNKLKTMPVVSDRFIYSTITYQSIQMVNNGVFTSTVDAIAWIKDMQFKSIGLRPTLKVLIDVDIETALSRGKNRGKLHPFEDRTFLERVRANYIDIAMNENDWLVLDGKTGTGDQIEDILNVLHTLGLIEK